MAMHERESQPDQTNVPTFQGHLGNIMVISKSQFEQILTKFHTGYFRISLSLCSQTLLWKTLGQVQPTDHPYMTSHSIFHILPSTAFSLILWSLALITLLSLSLLYILQCFSHFEMVKKEFLHHIGVNYLFAPWISWLLLLQSSPFFGPNTIYYQVLWLVFVTPIIALDVKIYGQWFIKGKRFPSTVANPTSHLSVIGNFVGARAAAVMGWRESAIFMFSLGMSHYLVLFVTLYQGFSENNCTPVKLRPVMFLFFAAPSMASLAWDSISGTFDNGSKMLFFLSLFLFMSLVSRPALFKKSMRKFSVAWWAYSFPLTGLAIASTGYAKEVKSDIANALMLILTAISVLVSIVLMVFSALSALNSNMPFLPIKKNSIPYPTNSCSTIV